MTREALARACGIAMDLDESILAHRRASAARAGHAGDQSPAGDGPTRRRSPRERQWHRAPGLWIEQRGTSVLLLPGRRARNASDVGARDRASRTACRQPRLFRRVIRITGRPESDVDAVAQPIYSRWRATAVPISTTILAKLGQIELHLTADAPTPPPPQPCSKLLSPNWWRCSVRRFTAADGRGLEEVTGTLPTERQMTVPLPRSCTGGLLASRITDVAGSSARFQRGVVTYSNEAKTEWLGVPETMLRAHGAVSEPVAEAMADGVPRAFESLSGCRHHRHCRTGQRNGGETRRHCGDCRGYAAGASRAHVQVHRPA